MTNVATITSNVKPQNHDAVTAWMMQMAQRGEIPTNSARLRVTALNQLVTVLGDDEPRELQWVLEHIEDIARRWAIKNTAKPDTAQAYLSRAKSALVDFLRWQADPAHFKFKVREATEGSTERPRKAREEKATVPQSKAETVPTAEQVVAPTAAPTTTSHAAALREYPLGGGRVFRFELPQGTDLTVNDVRRIVFHLLTLASDWDANAPAPFSSESITRK